MGTRGAVALPRDRRCMLIQREHAKGVNVGQRAAQRNQQRESFQTCNAGRAGAQPYPSRVPDAGTPTRAGLLFDNC